MMPNKVKEIYLSLFFIEYDIVISPRKMEVIYGSENWTIQRY